MHDDKAEFRITATVAAARGRGTNPRVAASGKVANLTLEVCRPGNDGDRPKRSFLDVVAFGETVADVRDLGAGESVVVVGELQTEKLTDKARNPVQSDGYDVWVTRLVARKVETLGQSAEQQPRTAQASTAIPASDDDIPF
jgi:single-stranded DNA-binding protein